MTKKGLINHFEMHATKHFSFSTDFKNMVTEFTKDAIEKIPWNEFEPDEKEFIEITPKDVFERCCYYAGIDPELVKSKSRKTVYVIIRQIYCLVASKYFGKKCSLGDIARPLGGKHHTTVIHSIKTAKEHFDAKDKLFVEYYDRIIPNLILVEDLRIKAEA